MLFWSTLWATTFLFGAQKTKERRKLNTKQSMKTKKAEEDTSVILTIEHGENNDRADDASAWWLVDDTHDENKTEALKHINTANDDADARYSHSMQGYKQNHVNTDKNKDASQEDDWRYSTLDLQES